MTFILKSIKRSMINLFFTFSEPSYESSTSESDSSSTDSPTKSSDTKTKSSDTKSRDRSRDGDVGRTVPGIGKQSETRQLKSKEIIKTSTPSRLHLKKGNFLVLKIVFLFDTD